MKVVAHDRNGISERLPSALPDPMARRAARIVAFLFLFLPLSAPGAAPPRPAPAVYATANYALTFRTPRGTTYCPLPRGWVGSDHGTILFLESPRDCGGAGYPSIGRGFTPAYAARIEVYYGYSAADDPPSWPPCSKAGSLVLLGGGQQLCRTDEGGMVSLTATAPYSASSAAEAVLTLRSRPARLAGDLAVLRRFAAALRTCTAAWPGRHGRRETFGSGPPCARSGWF
jgi:hypothetical protein